MVFLWFFPLETLIFQSLAGSHGPFTGHSMDTLRDQTYLHPCHTHLPWINIPSCKNQPKRKNIKNQKRKNQSNMKTMLVTIISCFFPMAFGGVLVKTTSMWLGNSW